MGGAIQQTRFATRDADAGTEFVRRMYVDSRIRLRAGDHGLWFANDLLLFAGVILGRVQMSMRTHVEADDGVERLSFFQVHQPMRSIGPRSGQQAVAPGGTMCLAPRVGFEATWDSLDENIVTLDTSLLADTAAPYLLPGQPLRFEFGGAVSPAAADTWQRTTRLVTNVAAANVTNPDGTLLANELSQLLISTALICFPNTTMRASAVPAARDSPASLRRAVAYIDEHLDQPIGLSDIATAARVSPRALNLTFNRHLDTSPLGYLRRVRLDRAHHDLLAAQPGDGQSVTTIAHRWGFSSLSRFGILYRQTYGRPPSRTLHR